jgi:hypothetical protein
MSVPNFISVKRSLPSTLILLLIVFGFYLITLAPSLNWADGARMQLDVMFGGSTYWSFDEASQFPTDGLPFDKLGVAAWDHPLYVMLAQVFVAIPIGEPLYRINLMSAVFGALTVAIVYQIGILLVSNRWIAALCAVAFAVSHTFWLHAVTSEAYTLNMFFMATIVLISLRWPVYQRWQELTLFAFIAGLGLANHIMLAITVFLAGLYIILATPSFIQHTHAWGTVISPKQYIYFFSKLGGKRVLLLIFLFIIGFAPWWIQFIRMAKIITLPVTLEVVVGFPWLGRRLGVTSGVEALKNILGYSGWLLFQFSIVGVIVGIYGFWRMWKSRLDVTIFLLAIFLVHVVFSANYKLSDQFNFHLPSYLAFVLGITWGCSELWKKIEPKIRPGRSTLRITSYLVAWVLVLLPVGLYAITPNVLRSLGLTEARLGIPPIGTGNRDAFEYFLNPNSRNDDSAARFARSTLEELELDAIVFSPKPSDQETYAVLRYVQLIEGKRPDVHLELMLFDPIDDIAQAILEQVHMQKGCRPLYLASLNPNTYPLGEFKEEFMIVPEANLYRLIPREPLSTGEECPDLADRWAGTSLDQLIRLAMRR